MLLLLYLYLAKVRSFSFKKRRRFCAIRKRDLPGMDACEGIRSPDVAVVDFSRQSAISDRPAAIQGWTGPRDPHASIYQTLGLGPTKARSVKAHDRGYSSTLFSPPPPSSSASATRCLPLVMSSSLWLPGGFPMLMSPVSLCLRLPRLPAASASRHRRRPRGIGRLVCWPCGCRHCARRRAMSGHCSVV